MSSHDDPQPEAATVDPVASTDPPAQTVRESAALLGRIGAHASWANTTDRTARTAPARAALERKFLEQAGGDVKRAESLRKLHYSRLALRSVQARRAKHARPAAGDLTPDQGA